MQKKIVIVCLACVLLLSSCGKRPDNQSMVFPKTTWEMSFQEVMEAWGVTEQTAKNYIADSRFVLEDRELFGEKAETINFQFYDYAEDGNPEFFYVQAVYPKDADMKNVLDEMKKVYGEPDSDVSFYHFSGTGTLSEYQADNPDHVKSWALDRLNEQIPEAELTEYMDAWKNYQPGLNKENMDEFAKNARTVRVSWITDGDWNRLEFDASNLRVYHTIKNQLKDSEI